MNNIINFAHRGASAVCPENTMAAFRKGLELGATGIETDVQMTKDGGLVLIHDETLNRTTSGTGYVKDHTLAELLEVDAGSWFGPEFKDERLPLLEDLLDLLQGRDTILNIELKNGTFLYPGMEEKVIAAVRDFKMSDRVIFSSFNHYSLAYCQSLAPEIRTGILYGKACIVLGIMQLHLERLRCMRIILRYCLNSSKKRRSMALSTILGPLTIPSG